MLRGLQASVGRPVPHVNNDPLNLVDPSGLRPTDDSTFDDPIVLMAAGCAGTACHYNPYNRGLIDGQYRVIDLTPCETGGDPLGPPVGSPFPVIGSTFGFCGPTANGLPAGFRQPASQLGLSWSGRVMVKNYETRQQWAYDDDGAHSCTIGYGHLIAGAGVSCASLGIAGSTRGPVGPQCADVTTSTRCEFMTNAQVDQLFDADVFQRDNHMHSVLGNIPLSQFEYDAIFQLVWAQPGWADPVVNALKSKFAAGDLGPNRSDAEVDAAYASLARLVRYPGTVLPQRSAAIQRLWTDHVYTHGQA